MYLEFIEFKAAVENRTGFRCFENQARFQQKWFGTSDMFTQFEELTLANKEMISSGSVAICMDTNDAYSFSAFKGKWIKRAGIISTPSTDESDEDNTASDDDITGIINNVYGQ